MSNLYFYVIDSETTGLSSSAHEMTEISIIRYSDRVQLSRNIKCETPETANMDALRITNKTMADLMSGDSKESVVDECERFFNQDNATPNHRCIIAHNYAFDKKFLHALWAKCNKEFPANLWIDTIALTKEFYNKQDEKTLNITKTATGKVSFQLQPCCDLVGVKKYAAAHSAKVDSRNTYLLFRDLIENKNIDYLPHIKTFPHYVKIEEIDYDLINFDDEEV